MDIYTYKGYVLPMTVFVDYLKTASDQTSTTLKINTKYRKGSITIGNPPELAKQLVSLFQKITKLKFDKDDDAIRRHRDFIRELTGLVLTHMGMGKDDAHEDVFRVFLTHRTHGAELGLGKWVIALVTADHDYAPETVKLFDHLGAEKDEWTELSV